jgi:hypothetical protein
MPFSLAHAGLSDWTEVTSYFVFIVLFAASVLLVVLYIVCELFLRIEECLNQADRRNIDAARRQRGFAVKITTGDFDGFGSPVLQKDKQ